MQVKQETFSGIIFTQTILFTTIFAGSNGSNLIQLFLIALNFTESNFQKGFYDPQSNKT